jgi:hypothetical protein
VPTDLTDAELDAIDARAKAATPGPWTREHPRRFAPSDVVYEVLANREAHGPFAVSGTTLASIHDTASAAADAAFIAAAREDVPRLVAEARDARACERAAMDARAIIAADRDRLARENEALRKRVDDLAEYAGRIDAELDTLRTARDQIAAELARLKGQS